MATSRKPVKKSGKAVAYLPKQPNVLLTELRGLIESARQHVAQTANATQTMLYWHVGQRIRRARSCKTSVPSTVNRLCRRCRRNCSRSTARRSASERLRRMVQFAEVFPDEKIIAALSRRH